MSSHAKVLVVDDRMPMLKLFLRLLREKFAVTTAESSSDALAAFERDEPDVVVTDIKMPDGDGLTLFRKIKELKPETEVILMTAFADVSQAVEAIHQGAFHYVMKPFEPDQLLAILDRALERKRLVEKTRYLEAEVASRGGASGIVGTSEPIKRVLELVDRVAASDSTVLVSGESGTGKELVARAIHSRSPRSAGRFVAVNCGAFPRDLVEAELFGHARGAFSGATGAKKGLVEEADGGTLLLDEVSEIDASLQVKLNRAIQEKEIRRVGETRERKVDVRFIAATNRDLAGDVREGRFREDLYFRLNVYPIVLPPLRERRDDIPALVQHFIEAFNRRFRRKVEGVEDDALARLVAYNWPGNVRELENVIERAILLEDTPRLRLGALPELTSPSKTMDVSIETPAEGISYRDYLELTTNKAQRAYLERVLARTGGNVTRSAEMVGLERETLHRILRKVGLRADQFRS